MLQAQQQVIPFANNTFIVSNDRTFTFSWTDEMTVSGLVISGYNTDIFPHTFYCTATVRNLPLPAPTEAEINAVAAAPEDLSDLQEDYLTPDSILDDDSGGIPPPVTTTGPVGKPPVKTKPKPKKVVKTKIGVRPPKVSPGPLRR
jgi:hypothetical protein